MRDKLQYDLFVKTKPRRLFFKASIPGAIGMLSSALYQTFDGVFVGNFLGSTAFASVNLAMPFVIINFAVADLIGVGSSVPISIALGSGRNEDADRIFTLASLMIVISGAITGLLLYLGAPFLMAFMGADGEFLSLAVSYLRLYAIFSPVTTMMFAADNYLRISGKIRMSMILNVSLSIFCAIFEFFLLGVMKMSIEGAALANCTGMMLMTSISLVPFFQKKLALNFVKPRFSLSVVKRIVYSGLPSFLNNIAGRMTSIVMNMMLVRLGGQDAVSVYGVLMYTDGIIQPIMYGACDSLQPAIGYNWGAGLYSRVRAVEKYCFLTAFLLCIFGLVISLFFPGFILSLFISSDIPSYAPLAVMIFALTYITRWISFATQSFMLAIERSVYATLISIAMAFVFPMVFLFVLSGLGLTGIWLNFPLTSFFGGMLSVLILLKEKKNIMRKDNPVKL